MSTNKNDVSISAEIKINKNEIANDILSALNTAQNIVDKNTVIVTLKGDTSDVEKKLKQLSEYERNNDINVLVRTDTDLLKKDLAFIKSSVGKSAEEIGKEFKNNLYTSLKSSNASISLDDLVSAKFGKTSINNTKKYLAEIQNELNNFKFSDEGFDEVKNVINKFNTVLELEKEISNFDFGKTGLSKKTFDISKYRKSFNNLFSEAGKYIENNNDYLVNGLEKSIDFSANKLEKVLKNAFNNINMSSASGAVEGTNELNNELKKSITDIENNLKLETESLAKQNNELNKRLTERKKLIKEFTDAYKEAKRQYNRDDYNDADYIDAMDSLNYAKENLTSNGISLSKDELKSLKINGEMLEELYITYKHLPSVDFEDVNIEIERNLDAEISKIETKKKKIETNITNLKSELNKINSEINTKQSNSSSNSDNSNNATTTKNEDESINDAIDEDKIKTDSKAIGELIGKISELIEATSNFSNNVKSSGLNSELDVIKNSLDEIKTISNVISDEKLQNVLNTLNTLNDTLTSVKDKFSEMKFEIDDKSIIDSIDKIKEILDGGMPLKIDYDKTTQDAKDGIENNLEPIYIPVEPSKDDIGNSFVKKIQDSISDKVKVEVDIDLNNEDVLNMSEETSYSVKEDFLTTLRDIENISLSIIDDINISINNSGKITSDIFDKYFNNGEEYLNHLKNQSKELNNVYKNLNLDNYNFEYNNNINKSIDELTSKKNEISKFKSTISEISDSIVNMYSNGDIASVDFIKNLWAMKKELETFKLDLKVGGKNNTLENSITKFISSNESNENIDNIKNAIDIAKDYITYDDDTFMSLKDIIEKVSKKNEDLKNNLISLVDIINSTFNNSNDSVTSNLENTSITSPISKLEEQVKLSCDNIKHYLDNIAENYKTLYLDYTTPIQSTKAFEEEILKIYNTISKYINGLSYNTLNTELFKINDFSEEKSALNDLSVMINNVTDAVDIKTNAFSIERQVVEGEVQREITALQELIGWIVTVRDTLETLQKTEVKVNINIPDLENINKKVSGNTALDDAANKFEDFTNRINTLDISDSSFIKDIKELISKGEELNKLADVLKTSESKIKKAVNVANTSSNTNGNKTNKNSTVDSYKIIKQNMNAILELTRKQSDSNNTNNKLIQDQIDKYRAAIEEQKELIGDQINSVYENEISIIQDKIDIQKEDNKQLAESMKAHSEEIELTILEWEEAKATMNAYKETLEDVVKVTRSSRRGNNGSELISYNVTDSLGDTRTFGKNGELLNTNVSIIDENKIEKIQNKIISDYKKYYSVLNEISKQNSPKDVADSGLLDRMTIARDNLTKSTELLNKAEERGYDIAKARQRIDAEKQALDKELKYNGDKLYQREIEAQNKANQEAQNKDLKAENKISYDVDTKKFDAEISNIETNLASLEKYQNKYKQDITANNKVLEDSLNIMKDENSTLELKKTAQEEFNKALATQKNIITQMKNDKKISDATTIVDNNINTDNKKKNTNYAPNVTADDINVYKEHLESLGMSTNDVDSEVRNLEQTINNINGKSFASKDIVNYTKNLSELGVEVSEITRLIQILNSNLNIINNDDATTISKAKAFNNVTSAFENAKIGVNNKNKSKKAAEKQQAQKVNKISQIDQYFSEGVYDTSLKKYSEDMKRLSENSDIAAQKVSELEDIILRMSDSDLSIDERIEAEKKYQEELDITKVKIKELNSKSGKYSTNNQTDIAIKNYEELTNKLNKYYLLLDKKSTANSLTAKQTKEFNELSEAIDRATKSIGEFEFTSNASVDKTNYGNAVSAFNSAKENARDTMSSNWIKDTKSNILSLISQNKNKSAEYTSELQKNLNKITEEEIKYKIDIDMPDDELQKVIKARQEIESTIKYIKSNKSYNLADTLDIDKAITKVTEWKNTNTKALKEYENEIESILDKLNKGNGTLSNTELGNLLSSFEKIKTKASEAGETGLTFFDKWKSRMGDLTTYLSSYIGFYEIFDALRNGIETVQELDTAFVEMQKVSNDSEASLKEFAEASFEVADSVGSTAVDIQNSVADWLRLGEDLSQATESAKVSNILLNISEFSGINDATEALVAMSSAYQDLDKMEIVDVLNNVGNNFSISTDGLAAALQDSASALTTAGNDINEAVALITAGNAITQDPDSVGSGIRTIALRLTGTEAAEDELEEMGEDTEGLITTVSKLEGTIKSATAVASNGFEGFDILDDNGNYKDTYEILQGIADIYKEIVETDKETGNNNANLLLETIAGKNRANIAASILENPDMLRDVYNSALNDSEGSANEELDKYLDSIDGKTDKLKNKLQELAKTTISTEAYKTILDIANGVLSAVIGIAEHLPTVVTAVTAIVATYKGFSFSETFKNAKSTIGNVKDSLDGLLQSFNKIKETSEGNIFKNLISGDIANTLQSQLDNATYDSNKNLINSSNIDSFIDINTDDSEALNKVIDKLKETSTIAKETGNTIKDSIKNIDDFGEGGSIALENFVDAFDETEWTSENLGKSVQSTKNGISSFGDAAKNSASSLDLVKLGSNLLQGALLGLATMGLELTIQFMVELSQVSDEVAEKANKLGSEFNTAKEDISDYKDEINDLQTTINSESSSYEETKEARERLMEIQDEMIAKYGGEKSAIEAITKATQGSIDALDGLTSLEWQKKLDEFQDESFGETVGNWFSGYDSNVDRMLDSMENKKVNISFGIVSNGSNAFKEFVEQVNSKYGNIIEGQAVANANFADEYSTFSLNIDGESTTEARKILLDIQTIAKSLNIDLGSAGDKITSLANKYGEAIDKYGDFYEEYEINDVLLNKNNELGVKSYKNLTDAYNEYKNATTDDEITKSLENYKNILSEIENGSNFEGKDFLINELFPEMQEVVENWDLKIKAQVEADEKETQENLNKVDEKLNTDILANLDLQLSDDTIKSIKDKLNNTELDVLLNADTKDFSERLSEELKKYTPLNNAYDSSSAPKESESKNSGTNKTQSVNVPTIKWDNSNLEQFKVSLNSLYDELNVNNENTTDNYLKNLSEGIKGTENSFKSMSGTFQGIDIAFSPVLETQDGKTTYLDKNTIEDYMNNIISRAKNVDGSIEISDIIKLDASGTSIDGVVIKNIITDIGETAKSTGEEINNMGDASGSLNEVEKAANSAGISYQEFLDKCDSGEVVYSQEDIVNAINAVIEKLQEESEKATYVNDLFSDETLELSNKISSLQSVIASIDEAITTINMGDLGADDVVNLLSTFPELINYIDISANGFGNIKEGLEEIKRASMESLIASIRETETATDAEAEALDQVCNLLEKMCTYNPNGNFDNMISNLNSIESSADSAVSAMQQLEQGTALTKSQLIDLAFEYPELLQQANLFTDGSIEGQKNMVQSILDLTDQQYDGIIDEKINELKAENEVFESQLKLEEQKRDLALQIETDLAEGKITTQAALVDALSELDKLEEQNAVEEVNGEIVADETKVNEILENQDNKVNETLDSEDVKVDQLEIDNETEANNLDALYQGELEANADTLGDMVTNQNLAGSKITDISNQAGENVGYALAEGSAQGTDRLNTNVQTIQNDIFGSAFYNKLLSVGSSIFNALKGNVNGIANYGGSAGGSGVSNIDIDHPWNDIVGQPTWKTSGGVSASEVLSGKKKAATTTEKSSTKKTSSDEAKATYKGTEVTLSNAKDILENIIGSSSDLSDKISSAITSNNNAINNLQKLKDYTPSEVSTTGNSSSGNSGSGNSGSGNSNKDKTSSDSEDTSKSYDLIAIAIERTEAKIERLDKTASASYKKWTTRNTKLKSEIDEIATEIALQNSSYNAYIKAANSVGLSDKYKKMIQNGGTNIFTTTNEKLQEKIDLYQEYWEAAQECKDKITDLESDIADVYNTIFSNIQSKYDGILAGFEHSTSMINEYISQAETDGYLTSNTYYEGLEQVENNNLKKLKAEKSELETAMNNAIANGIDKESEDWYNMCNEIDSVTEAIEASNTALKEYAKTIKDNNWDLFDKNEDYKSQITTESDYLIDLLSNQDLYDDNGSITNEGQAVNGLHAVNYNVYMAQADDYAEKIKSIDKDLAKDPYNVELLEKRQSLLQSQRDYISNAEDEKQAMIDLAKNGYDTLLSAIQEVIDKKKEQLQTEKDLYEYEKNIKEKTESVSTIQKQLNAYKGDTSEEAKATVQKLEVSLKSAEDDLQETEYEQYLTEQQNMMDNMYSELEEHLSLLTEDIKLVIQNVIDNTNTNAETIKGSIDAVSQNVGYDISNELKSVWEAPFDNVSGIKTVVTSYSNTFSTELTAVRNSLNTINSYLAAAQKKADSTATTKVNADKTSSKSGTSKVNVSTNTNTSKTTSKNTNTSKTTSKKTTTSKTTTKKTTSSSTKKSSKSDSFWGQSWLVKYKDTYSKSKLDVN